MWFWLMLLACAGPNGDTDNDREIEEEFSMLCFDLCDYEDMGVGDVMIDRYDGDPGYPSWAQYTCRCEEQSD